MADEPHPAAGKAPTPPAAPAPTRPAAGAPSALTPGEPELPPEFLDWPKPRFTLVHGVILANILILAGVLVAVVGPWSRSRTVVAIAHPAPAAAPASPGPAPAAPALAVTPESFSLEGAERAYAEGRWVEALAQCQPLIAAAAGAQDELVADFFRLRSAQCLRRLGQVRQARDGLVAAASSRSPLVRGAALAETANLDVAERQYLTGRTHAYHAVAALGAAPGTEPLQLEALFLAADALTRRTLAFWGEEDHLPSTLATADDPFKGLTSEAPLRARLAAGAERQRQAALGPKAERTLDAQGGYRWTVTSAGAPLEEFLGRVAAEANLNIAWTGTDAAVRRRAVFLALTGAPDYHVLDVACGAAGLVARQTGAEVQVYDPATMPSTDALRDLLVKEAVSAWRRLLLAETRDDRLPHVHLALGMLHERQGEKASAMTEYRHLGQRFPRSALAPQAGLRSAAIRIELRDYPGARSELIDLLNRYPTFPSVDEAYLRLGTATMEAGLLDEAVATFSKLYYSELSRPSQMGAALGAGTCYWRKGDPAAATTWLERHLKLAGADDGPQVAEANFLLAKCLLAQGKADEARAALERALAAKPADDVRVDVTLELARTLGDQGELATALPLIGRLHLERLSHEREEEATLVHARLLRQAGLPDQGLRMLRDSRAKASSPEMLARIETELGRCCLEMGDTDAGRRLLVAAVPRLPNDAQAHEAAALLASLYLEAGNTGQAVSLCRALLAKPVPETVRRQAFTVLGRAYLTDRDYARAALAFSGKVPDSEGDARP